jgi:hypothetical protein
MTYQKSLQKLDTLYIFKNNSHYLRFKVLDSIDYSVEFISTYHHQQSIVIIL